MDKDAFGDHKSDSVDSVSQHINIENVNLDNELNGKLPQYIEPACYSFRNPLVSKDVSDSGAFKGASFDATTKVGQTTQLVSQRLKEWRRVPGYDSISHIADVPLSLGIVSENGQTVYTDDHSYHKALRRRGFVQTLKTLKGAEYDSDYKWSQEFYTDVTGENRSVDRELLEEIRDEIADDYSARKYGYSYLTAEKDSSDSDDSANSGGTMKLKQARITYPITDDFAPRGYQQKAVDTLFAGFINGAHYNQQLLYAPTRSGKSAMATWFMKELAYHAESKMSLSNNNGVGNVFAVVTAKADVRDEWKQIVEGHNDFASYNPDTGKRHFVYIDVGDLKRFYDEGKNALDEKFLEADNIVVFMTLQDLSESANHESKPHHKQIAGRVSYVVGDECHFGMFGGAAQYINAMRGYYDSVDDVSSVDSADKDYGEGGAAENHSVDEDRVAKDAENLEIGFKALNPKYGYLYISATPFTILVNGGIEGFMMGGDNSNVVIVSPNEIQAEADKWIEDNPDKKEWESQYFGIVQQHYFGVNVGEINSIMLPEQSLVIDEDGNQGYTDTPFLRDEAKAKDVLSGLFVQTLASSKNSDSSLEKKSSADVNNASAGSNDDNDNDENEDNTVYPDFFVNEEFLGMGVGNHILLVLPRRASTDAVERILTDLGVDRDYELINISSADESHYYKKTTIAEYKSLMSDFDDEGKKTITLTVNKATTGVSIKQIDTTMMMAKSDSMEKTTQIMGRQNTPYVETFKKENGDVSFKKAVKQHTAFISFAVSHLYETVERLDRVYEQAEGNNPDRREKERFSSGRVWEYSSLGMVEVSVTDVRKELNKALASEGVSSLAKSIPFDLGKLDEMNAVEHKYLADRDLEANEVALRSTLFGVEGSKEYEDAISGGESGSDDDNENSVDTNNQVIECVECRINTSLYSLGDEAWEKFDGISVDEVLCESCNIKQINKRNREAAVMADKDSYVVYDSDGNSEEVSTGTFDADGEENDPDAEQAKIKKELAKEKRRLIAEQKKNEIQMRDNLRGMMTLMLVYIAVSHHGDNGEPEWNITEIQSSLKNNGAAAATADRLGFRLEDIEFLLRFADRGVMNSHIFTVRNQLADEELSKWERLRFVIKDLPSISANEIFTPDNVAELVVETLDFDDDDYIALIEGSVGNSVSAAESGSESVVGSEGMVAGFDYTGGSGGLLDIGSKEAAMLVVVERKALEAIDNRLSVGAITVEGADELKRRLSRDVLFALPSSSMTYEIIHKVFRDHGWNTDNILYADNGSNVANWGLNIIRLKDSVAKMKEYYADLETGKRRKSVKTEEKMMSEQEELMADLGVPVAVDADSTANTVSDAFKAEIAGVIARMEAGFEAVVGNPPYQLEVRAADDRGVADTSNIFPFFQETAQTIAKSTSLIYPAGRWIRGSGRGCKSFGRDLLLSPHLKEIKVFYGNSSKNIFPHVNIGDGISIVHWDEEYDSSSIVFNDNSIMKAEDSHYPFSESQEIIDLCLKLKESWVSLEKNTVVKQRFKFNDDSASQQNAVEVSETLDPALFETPIKAMLLDRPGIRGRVKVYWIEDSVTKNRENLDKWKVVMNSNIQGNETVRSWRFSLIEKGVVFGDQRIPLGYFSSAEEAGNFHAYLETQLVRSLMSAAGGSRNRIGTGLLSFVPDLGDYTNSNPLFSSDDMLPDGNSYTGTSLSERLYEHFGLSGDEIAVIEDSGN